MRFNLKLSAVWICIFTSAFVRVDAQSFRKGSILVSISEGTTAVDYSTSDGGKNNTCNLMTGNRDPIALEYGLTSHWGVGITSGADIYNIDINKQYAYTSPIKPVRTITSEATLDVYYHFLVTRRVDLSTYLSVGANSIGIKGTPGDGVPYQYTASGNVIRTGLKGRYYVTKRFALMNILSCYNSGFSTQHITGNTFGNGYSTNIRGLAWEFGLSYRVRR